MYTYAQMDRHLRPDLLGRLLPKNPDHLLSRFDKHHKIPETKKFHASYNFQGGF